VKKEKKIPRALIFSFLVALAAVLLGGAWFLRAQEDHLLQEIADELRAIATLKTEEITRWRRERMGDAAVLMDTDLFRKDIPAWLAHPEGDPAKILRRFQVLAEHYHYDNILLLDPAGNVRLSLSGILGPLHLEGRAALEESWQTGRPVITDLHRDPEKKKIHLGVAAPLFDPEGEPAGAVVLQSDAREFLFPLIRTWPVPSKTAETLLVRREGDEVVFLNDLRHRQGAALELRFPLEEADLPAARAVREREGFYRGRDYRGVRVLAAFLPVPGSSWFMVSKVDEAEALSPWRARALLILGLILALVLFSGSLAALVWQRILKTYLRRAQEEIKKLNVELEGRVAQRTAQLAASNRELEAFAYSVSHDLRTPLRAVEGFSRILLDDFAPGLGDEGSRLIGVIRANTLRMDRLIADLLDLSRAGLAKIKYSRVEMTALARAAFAEAAPPEILARCEFSLGDLPEARGDPALLRQVWDNLLSNAVKYTAPRDLRRIEVVGERKGAEAVYRVRDTGVGFDPRYAHKLFGVFQRLHTTAEFPGTGIGLAIVKRIVERHGGRVEAESRPGEGAEFRFFLPARTPED
jgi:signal transduction histidine kinase